MNSKISEHRYATPAKPPYERNYFFVALLLIVSFFGYSMWVLHREASTIPIVQEWRYYPRLTGGQGNVAIGYEALHNVTGNQNIGIGHRAGYNRGRTLFVTSCDTIHVSYDTTSSEEWSDTVWVHDMRTVGDLMMFPGKVYIDLQGMDIDEWRKLNSE